jgi:hypothetical protein
VHRWHQGRNTPPCTGSKTGWGETAEIALSEAVSAKPQWQMPWVRRNERVSGANPLVGSTSVTGWEGDGSAIPAVDSRFRSGDAHAGRAGAGRSISAGMEIRGVSSLRMPVLLEPHAQMRAGRALAFILPTELLTEAAEETARRSLLESSR